jgi:hypothetical protein
MAEKRPKTIKSIRALAPLVGKSVSAVRKWTKHPRWYFSRFGPWTMDDVRLIKGWAERYLKHDAAADYHERIKETPGAERPLSRMEQARLACLVERAMTLKQRREIEKGLMHVAKTCETNILRVVRDVNGQFLAMPRTMAHTLAGRDAASIEAMLDQRVRAILKGLAVSLGLQPKAEDGSDSKNPV